MACVAALGLACSQTSRYRTLSFFFEGVPDPFAPLVPEGLEEQIEEVESLEPSFKSTKSLHEPFAERLCEECHSMFTGGNVKAPIGGLCISCHDDFLDQQAFLHGPVAVGACRECHHPHASELPSLLLQSVEPLCFGCHSEQRLAGGEYHDDFGTTDDGCIRCHDPHGGDNGFFLKPPDAD